MKRLITGPKARAAASSSSTKQEEERFCIALHACWDIGQRQWTSRSSVSLAFLTVSVQGRRIHIHFRISVEFLSSKVIAVQGIYAPAKSLHMSLAYCIALEKKHGGRRYNIQALLSLQTCNSPQKCSLTCGTICGNKHHYSLDEQTLL